MILKLISFNVNGLRAIVKKSFEQDFAALDADIFALQETKLQAEHQQFAFAAERYQYFNYSQAKKGYSGTAVFSKQAPLNVFYGIGQEEHDQEGRVITLEYEHFYFVTVYTPNAQDGLKRLDYRLLFEEAFLNYLQTLDTKKPLILCGDLNVAHEEIDLANPASNHKSPGFSDEERAAFSRLLAAGFADTFRTLHPEAREAYTWWSYRTRARERNIGWRIDYFVVSERLLPAVKAADILADIEGSDHCPVELILDDDKLAAL